MDGSIEPRSVRRARYAVSAIFLIFGLIAGFWFVHIPVVAGRLALEPAVLGLALLCFGLGSLIFQPVAGVLVGRLGSRRATVTFAVTLLVAMPIVINAVNAPMLFVALLVGGASGGALNVALNTQASKVETARGRPTMSVFHGFFSLGMLCASVAGAAVIERGWGDGSGAIAANALLLPVVLAAGAGLLPDSGPEEEGRGKRKAAGARFALPAGALLGLATLAFLANAIEFTVNDWSALFLTTEKGATAAEATRGLGLFALAMTVFRFAGGLVVSRIGAKRVVAGGGALAAIGMIIALASEDALLSTSGFLFIGIGASNLAPLLLSQASRIPGVAPGIGVAATATGMTAGFLLAPPIIGFVAQAFTLPVALGLSIVFGAIISAGALMRTWHGVAPSPPG
ncbi:MAG: MFS transporter [Bauldia sp.]|nr:MFS transporter [Bauldia sp.]